MVPDTTFYSHSGSMVPDMEVEVEDNSKFHQTTKREEGSSLAKTEHDTSRIPELVELDLSRSETEWRRRRIVEEETRRIGESVEAMILEQVRWEPVRDICMWLVLRFEVSIASVDIPPGNVHGAQRSKGAQMRI
jgi:hypothetical protein